MKGTSLSEMPLTKHKLFTYMAFHLTRFVCSCLLKDSIVIAIEGNMESAKLLKVLLVHIALKEAQHQKAAM